MGASNGESEPPVFNRFDPRVRDEAYIHLVLDQFVQPRDEQRMLTGQTRGIAHIWKNNRLGSIFWIHHESLALSTAGQPVDLDSDVPQYPNSGRMQPFPCQPSGRLEICLEEDHPSSLARVHKRTKAAYRTAPDDRHVVIR